nr:MAG TPA: hypothetical protein [Caudoviricetes sp.]
MAVVASIWTLILCNMLRWVSKIPRVISQNHPSFLYTFHKTREGVTGKWHFL